MTPEGLLYLLAGMLVGALCVAIANYGRYAELRARSNQWHRMYRDAEDNLTDVLEVAREYQRQLQTRAERWRN